MTHLNQRPAAAEQIEEIWLEDTESTIPDAVGRAHLSTGALPERLLHLRVRIGVRAWPNGEVEHLRVKLGDTLLQVMYAGGEELKRPILPPRPAKPLDALRVRMHRHEWSEPIQDLQTPLWMALASGYSRQFAIEYTLAVQINARWGVAEQSEMTPRELLNQFGFEPSEYSLYKADGKDPLPPDESIHLKRGEKFEAQKDGRYGAAAVCVQNSFELEFDALAPAGIEAVVHSHNGQTYLEVSNVAVPSPLWSKARTAILFAVPATYPVGGLDAFYVEASLGHSSGTVPYQQGVSVIAGKEWRLISWHYTLNRPWNSRTDDLGSHIEHCRGFFMTRGVGQ